MKEEEEKKEIQLEKIISLQKNLNKIKERLTKTQESKEIPEHTQEQKKFLPKLPKVKLHIRYGLPFFIITIIFIVDFLTIGFAYYNLFTILFIIFTLPVFFILFLYLAVRLFLDRRKINKKIIPVFTKNFIILNFLTNNKKIIEILSLINSDGISTTVGKRDYMIDKEEIWYDEKNYPNSFYFPELPNPLRISAKTTIENYFKLINSPDFDLSKAIETDIAFSSTNLQLFKKDKIFTDLNKREDFVDSKFMYLLIGIVAFLILTIIILVVVLK